MNNDFPVEYGSTQNEYMEYDLTIAAGGQETIFEAHDYFRVLSLSAATLSVRFGQNARVSPWLGSGLGKKHHRILDRVTLINTGGAAITVRVALALGQVSDDRLNVSGTITTITNSPATLTTLADVALNNASATLILAASSTTREVIISNPIANGVDLRVGDSAVTATRGAILAAGQTIALTTAAAVYVFANAASKTLAVTYTGD
jgi:hypothetical protein